MTSDSGHFHGYEMMVNLVGMRHAKCWFTNYEVGNDESTDERSYALETAKQFAKDLQENKRSGKNLILMGSCGTGKDHLAVSVLRVAVGLGMSTRLRRGSVICSECRKSTIESQCDVPSDLWQIELLVISDIEPHADKPASDFEQRALLELIDRRYTAMLPTVVTSNKRNRSELCDSIGKRIVDRLCEGATLIPMTWDSYREKPIQGRRVNSGNK